MQLPQIIGMMMLLAIGGFAFAGIGTSLLSHVDQYSAYNRLRAALDQARATAQGGTGATTVTLVGDTAVVGPRLATADTVTITDANGLSKTIDIGSSFKVTTSAGTANSATISVTPDGTATLASGTAPVTVTLPGVGTVNLDLTPLALESPGP